MISAPISLLMVTFTRFFSSIFLNSMTDFELVDELSRIGHVAVPKAIEEIRTAKVLHDTVCEVAEMPEVVKKFLAI